MQQTMSKKRQLQVVNAVKQFHEIVAPKTSINQSIRDFLRAV